MQQKSKKISKNKFQSIPCITITGEEPPFKLFAEMYNKYKQFGAVQLKINWQMRVCIENSKREFRTIYQNLKNLPKGEPFQKNGLIYTARSFKQMALKFEKKYNPEDYWDLMGNDIQIEYASDLKRFSGFPMKSFQGRLFDHPYNMNNIQKQQGSLFQFVHSSKDQISGVTNSWLYLGMIFATFCWHTENMYFGALNYHHKGAPKQWYFIPSQHLKEFESFVESNYPKGILKDLSLQINPKHFKFPVYQALQVPNSFILIFPKVYHSGYSYGFNITEAINIAQQEHLQYYEESLSSWKAPIFPIELFSNGAKDFNLYERDQIDYYANKHREEEMLNRKGIKVIQQNYNYYEHPCQRCQRFTFLTYSKCKKCSWEGCLKCSIAHTHKKMLEFYGREI